MNSFIKNGFIALASALMVLAGVIVLGIYQPQTSLAGNPLQAPISYTATGTRQYAVNAAGWAEQILATTTSANPRLYVAICNRSTNIVYLAFEADMFTNSSSSIGIGQGTAGIDSCYEITDRNMYWGSVRASSTNAATAVTVIEFAQ
jgi:hypothetical protein